MRHGGLPQEEWMRKTAFRQVADKIFQTLGSGYFVKLHTAFDYLESLMK